MDFCQHMDSFTILITKALLMRNSPFGSLWCEWRDRSVWSDGQSTTASAPSSKGVWGDEDCTRRYDIGVTGVFLECAVSLEFEAPFSSVFFAVLKCRNLQYSRALRQTSWNVWNINSEVTHDTRGSSRTCSEFLLPVPHFPRALLHTKSGVRRAAVSTRPLVLLNICEHIFDSFQSALG